MTTKKKRKLPAAFKENADRVSRGEKPISSKANQQPPSKPQTTRAANHLQDKARTTKKTGGR